MRSFGIEEARIHAAYERRGLAAQREDRFDPGYLFMMQEIERRMLDAIKREGMLPLRSQRILEIGCGNGQWLREFVKWGATPEKLTGVELLSDRLDLARRLSPAGVQWVAANAARLKFAADSFDIVLQATVFTSILDASLKQAVAAEMLRVLRPGGIILWYDFRVDNPRNQDVHGVGKAEIAALFPGCRIALTRTILLPPLLRLLAPHSWLFCHALSLLPWACTHYVGTIRKNGVIE